MHKQQIAIVLDDAHNSSSNLFHSVTELQRRRVESELELRRLESEINQNEFKLNRFYQKLQALEETISQTEQDSQKLENELVSYKETSQVQDAATNKLRSNLVYVTNCEQNKIKELLQKKQEYAAKLSTWQSTVTNKLQSISTNERFTSFGKTADI